MKQKKSRTKKTVKVIISIILTLITVLSAGIFISNESKYTLDLSYPKELRQLYENNIEAREFVLSYHEEKNKEHIIALSEYKNDTRMPLFLQWDKRWGFTDYGGECAAVSACGPLCLSMVGYHLTKNEELFSPDKVIEFAKREGYCLPFSGTSWTLMSDGAAELGLTCEELPLDEDIIIKALEESKPIILIVGPGKFTTSGHFIVLRAYKNGKFYVNDPNSPKKSKKRWSYNEFKDEIRNIWAFSYNPE